MSRTDKEVRIGRLADRASRIRNGTEAGRFAVKVNDTVYTLPGIEDLDLLNRLFDDNIEDFERLENAVDQQELKLNQCAMDETVRQLLPLMAEFPVDVIASYIDHNIGVAADFQEKDFGKWKLELHETVCDWIDHLSVLHNYVAERTNDSGNAASPVPSDGDTIPLTKHHETIALWQKNNAVSAKTVEGLRAKLGEAERALKREKQLAASQETADLQLTPPESSPEESDKAKQAGIDEANERIADLKRQVDKMQDEIHGLCLDHLAAQKEIDTLKAKTRVEEATEPSNTGLRSPLSGSDMSNEAMLSRLREKLHDFREPSRLPPEPKEPCSIVNTDEKEQDDTGDLDLSSESDDGSAKDPPADDDKDSQDYKFDLSQINPEPEPSSERPHEEERQADHVEEKRSRPATSKRPKSPRFSKRMIGIGVVVLAASILIAVVCYQFFGGSDSENNIAKDAGATAPADGAKLTNGDADSDEKPADADPKEPVTGEKGDSPEEPANADLNPASPEKEEPDILKVFQRLAEDKVDYTIKPKKRSEK